jgi:hypothetical protein
MHRIVSIKHPHPHVTSLSLWLARLSNPTTFTIHIYEPGGRTQFMPTEYENAPLAEKRKVLAAASPSPSTLVHQPTATSRRFIRIDPYTFQENVEMSTIPLICPNYPHPLAFQRFNHSRRRLFIALRIYCPCSRPQTTLSPRNPRIPSLFTRDHPKTPSEIQRRSG